MNLIYKAFEQLHAEEELKEETKQFLISRASGRTSFRPVRLAVSLCILALCVMSIFGVYSVRAEAAYIQLDSKARIGLSINRWQKVIKASGLNPEGSDVLESLQVTGLSYQAAVNEILDSEKFCGYSNEASKIRVHVSCGNGNHQMEKEITRDVTTRCHEHLNKHHRKKGYVSETPQENTKGTRHNSRQNKGCHNGNHEE